MTPETVLPPSSDLRDQHDRVVLVTGAAGAIGGAIAASFARLGAYVVLHDATPDLAAQAASRIEPYARVSSSSGDIADPATARRAVDMARSEGGGLDVLINCAALVGRAAAAGYALDVAPLAWQRVIDVNLSGAFYFSQEAARAMETRAGGAIVNISSIAGLLAQPHAAAYSAAKAGLIGLTRALALDFAHLGIRVNAVAPGPIDTEGAQVGTTPEAEEALSAPNYVRPRPLGLGRPEDVANAVVFLAGDSARFMTGATLVIDGGVTVHC